MGRADRIDYPGMYAHVSNRGVARRPIFEADGEMRLFLGLLAKQVRLGRVEVLSYALLLNHFHLLVRSPKAAMGVALQVVQGEYSRRFNARRGRDGGLFKGRYHSTPIETDVYFHTVVRYIDDNVVRAGLCARARDYVHCSAHHYARRRGPRWLRRLEVEREVREALALNSYDPARYDEVFPSVLPDDTAQLVEARLESRAPREDADLDLLRASPRHVRRWLLENTRLADGRIRRRPFVGAREAIRGLRPDHDEEGPLAVALLRIACGVSFPEIAARLGLSVDAVKRRWSRHRTLAERGDYAQTLTALLRTRTRA